MHLQSMLLLLLPLALVALGWATREARRRAEARAEAARLAKALAEAERWAAVGREVSPAAHRLANAIAVVRTNLRWLGEDEPRDDQERAERAEVLDETLEAVERIAAVAGELRRQVAEARLAGDARPVAGRPAAGWADPEPPGADTPVA